MKVTPEFSKVNTQDYEDCLPASSEPSNLSTSTEITTLKPTKPEKRTFWQKCQTGFVYARPMLSMLIIDVGLPLLIYYVLRIWVSILIALILSGIPPLIHVIITFIRKRRINILGCVFVISYIISAVLSLVTGDIRLTLLRDSAVTAIVGGMFLITLIPLKTKWLTFRPMTFLISQQAFANLPPVAWVDRDGQEHTMPTTDFNWKHVRVYRRFCYILTGSWSVFLLGEFIAKVIMIKSTLDVERIVLYGNIILICVFVISINMTLIGSYFVRKRTRAVTGDWLKIHDYRVDQRRNGHFRHDI